MSFKRTATDVYCPANTNQRHRLVGSLGEYTCKDCGTGTIRLGTLRDAIVDGTSGGTLQQRRAIAGANTARRKRAGDGTAAAARGLG